MKRKQTKKRQSATVRLEGLGREGSGCKQRRSERGCSLYRIGRVGPSQTELCGERNRKLHMESCSELARNGTRRRLWKHGGDGVGGKRWASSAQMRLCAVGNVLLPEGLQPQDGGEGCGCGCRSRTFNVNQGAGSPNAWGRRSQGPCARTAAVGSGQDGW